MNKRRSGGGESRLRGQLDRRGEASAVQGQRAGVLNRSGRLGIGTPRILRGWTLPPGGFA
jgi:hypothetical protein